jgi:hypothetical protein
MSRLSEELRNATNGWFCPCGLVLLSSLPAVQDGRKGSFIALRTLSLSRVLEEDMTL